MRLVLDLDYPNAHPTDIPTTFKLLSQKLAARVGFRYRHRIIADNFDETVNQVFYPGPTAALAAPGACALVISKRP